MFPYSVRVIVAPLELPTRESHWQVEQVRRVELGDDVVRPVFQYLEYGEIICNAKHQIHVGPAISLPKRQGTHDRTSDDL